MKRIIYGFAAVFAAGSLLADTAVWTKTDEYENLNGDNSSYLTNPANWQSGSAPQSGDSLSFPNQPDPGVERISAALPGGYTDYIFDTISGLAAYDFTFGKENKVTVNDASGFYGVFRVRYNHAHSGSGYDAYPAQFTLNATSEHVPVVNNLDNRFYFAVNVPTTGTKAVVSNVVHTAPGAFRKQGAGELEATFTAGSDHKVYVDEGQLTVHTNAQSVALGQALVFETASIGVCSGETIGVGAIAANGGTLSVKGSGDLLVGTLVNRDAQGHSNLVGKVNVELENGGFGVLPVQAVDSAKIVSTPYIHLDASAENVFTFDAEDPTLVATWSDPDSGLTATGTARADGGRLPKYVANGLNGKPVIDFGTGTDKNHSGDGTAGYVAFTETPTVRAAFLVCRRKDLSVAVPFLGGDQEWKCPFRGYPDVPASFLVWEGEGNPSPNIYLGDARVDGVAIDIRSFLFSDTDFHVLSLEVGEDMHAGAGNNGTSFVGAAPYWQQFGGMELAEAIIYDAPLAEGERVEIEKQLLAKWLPAKAPTTARTMEIGTLSFSSSGDMPVTANRNMSVETISGEGTLVKKGTGSLAVGSLLGVGGVDVKAGTLAFSVEGSSGGEPDIMKNAWYRMDPSNVTTLTTNEEGRVTRIADANGGTSYFEKSYLFFEHPDYYNWDRPHVEGPSIVAAPTTGLNLLDFGPYQKPNTSNSESIGMDLVVNGHHISEDMHWVDAARTAFVRTVIAVVEKTGGGSDGDKQAFVGGRLWSKFSTTQGMLSDSKNDDANVSTWYFDGNACDPTTTVWPEGGLHVIACSYPEPSNDLPVHLLAQENDKDSPDHMGGLRYGEVLLFKEALSPADLRQVALYLKEKWLGSEKDTSMGYSTISVAAGASCSITGDITIADDSTVTIGTARTGNGTVTVDGTVTIGKRVAVEISNGKGRIPLVTATAFEETDSLSTWTLNGSRLRYSIGEDGTLYAECGSPGFVLIVR